MLTIEEYAAHDATGLAELVRSREVKPSDVLDAGVAAGFCLGVVHPDMVSVAGVAPLLVHLARSRETFQVSGVGPYPRASTLEYFRGLGNEIPVGLPRTVVPAAPDAWCTALERWGTMSFADVIAPALEHAERGFAVSQFSAPPASPARRSAGIWRRRVGRCARSCDRRARGSPTASPTCGVSNESTPTCSRGTWTAAMRS